MSCSNRNQDGAHLRLRPRDSRLVRGHRRLYLRRSAVQLVHSGVAGGARCEESRLHRRAARYNYKYKLYM